MQDGNTGSENQFRVIPVFTLDGEVSEYHCVVDLGRGRLPERLSRLQAIAATLSNNTKSLAGSIAERD